jgi:pimeloyl-ACP methyl ester carboxylesterase
MSPAAFAKHRAPKLLSRNAPKEVVQEAVSIMEEVRLEGYEFAARAMASAGTRGAVQDISIPALLIWGAEDEITPLWQDVPRGVRVEIVPDAGHLCYLEQPERFNQIVREFLKRLVKAEE